VQTGVRNFFSNIADVFISVNNLLQGKVIDAANDGLRVAVNTTIGGLGVMDWASEMGLEKHNEDFGQTFGRWGVEDGPYLVWPLFGSSTARDTVGELIDIRVDPVRNHKPVTPRNAMYLTRVVSKRADLLDASRILEEAALDKYVFERDAYLQRRRNLIYDGNPPRSSARSTPPEPVSSSYVPASEKGEEQSEVVRSQDNVVVLSVSVQDGGANGDGK
jgi:phospholipid-binding lipoprotein MlaA